MFATLALYATLLQPSPAPVAVPAGQPAIQIERPSWAFASMNLPDEPSMPMLPEWIEFVDGERVESLMASVSPFDAVDGADPFEDGR